MRQVSALLVAFGLIGCAASGPQLTHTSPNDPVWALNADKWNPPGGNALITAPTMPSGRIPSAGPTQ